MVEAYRARQPFPPSLRRLAERLNMSPQALTNWRTGLSELPKRRTLLAFADLAGLPYERVLDAALRDANYLPESAARGAEGNDEIVTRAARRSSKHPPPMSER